MKNFIFVILSLCVLLLASCTQPTYIPNKIHVPFFDKQGQIEVEGSYTSSSESLSEFAVGYSITDHLAVVGSVKLRNMKKSDSVFQQTLFFDGGTGWFFSEKDNPFRFEAFARIGKGYLKAADIDFGPPFDFFSHHDYTEDSIGFFSFDYLKYTLQANVGFAWRFVDLGFSIRTGYIRFQNVSIERRLIYNDSLLTNIYSGDKGSAFFDFGFTARFKPYENIGIEIQAGLGSMGETIGFKGSNSSLLGGIGLIFKF